MQRAARRSKGQPPCFTPQGAGGWEHPGRLGWVAGDQRGDAWRHRPAKPQWVGGTWAVLREDTRPLDNSTGCCWSRRGAAKAAAAGGKSGERAGSSCRAETRAAGANPCLQPSTTGLSGRPFSSHHPSPPPARPGPHSPGHQLALQAAVGATLPICQVHYGHLSLALEATDAGGTTGPAKVRRRPPGTPLGG